MASFIVSPSGDSYALNEVESFSSPELSPSWESSSTGAGRGGPTVELDAILTNAASFASKKQI